MSSSERYEVLMATLPAPCAEGDGDAKPAEPGHESAPWEQSLQATCECLSWRGALDNPARRRAEDELGTMLYCEFPAHARSVLVTAHMLIDAGAISEHELKARMTTVRERLRRR